MAATQELTNLHPKFEADERHNNPELPRVDSMFSGTAQFAHFRVFTP
jgi:hypothetical protein